MKTLPLLMPGKKQNASYCLDRPSLASDQPPKIIRRDPYGKFKSLAANDRLGNLDQLRRTNQRFNYLFDSFFHFLMLEVMKVWKVLEVEEAIFLPRLSRLSRLPKLSLLCRSNWIVLYKALDGLRRLGADADPMLNSFVIQFYLRWIEHRIVSPDVFEIFAIALRTLFLHHETVKRFPLRAHSHQTNC